MRGIVLTGIRQMKLVDLPAPKIENEDDVLLKIKMVGITILVAYYRMFSNEIHESSNRRGIL